MTTQELAYTEVERLVRSFKGMPAAQRRGMNEMQTRLGHILPLFRALGWDTSNINEEKDLDKVRTLEKQIDIVDREIDRRVYALYGLTDEEIRIVEGGEMNTPRSIHRECKRNNRSRKIDHWFYSQRRRPAVRGPVGSETRTDPRTDPSLFLTTVP